MAGIWVAFLAVYMRGCRQILKGEIMLLPFSEMCRLCALCHLLANAGLLLNAGTPAVAQKSFLDVAWRHGLHPLDDRVISVDLL